MKQLDLTRKEAQKIVADRYYKKHKVMAYVPVAFVMVGGIAALFAAHYVGTLLGFVIVVPAFAIALYMGQRATKAVKRETGEYAIPPSDDTRATREGTL